ncbi:MAG: AAA family ATPase, partial [Candidatus Aenigmatarchaeota archaeon]
VKTLAKSLLILTLPSSLLEHYDENAERLFQQIQHITGRMEKVYTPVEDEEVSSVIIKRLFSNINEKEAKDNIEEFLDYAEKEKLLPEGIDKSYYREKFMKSFPFQPEVIDVLYKRWGSFPNFQRTRGVLRILALVVHSLKDSKNPFIRLGDIDLRNEEIRRELIKHIGNEFDSILAADITSPDSGAKRVDRSLGSAYSPFSFGTKCATTIFMYSFSGGPERGITLQELKLSCAEVSHPSSIIVETVQKLKENLFYLSDSDLFFTNQPNLNRIFFVKAESIDDREIESEEKEIIKDNLSETEKKFDIFIWPDKSKDIPDTKKLKLVILKDYPEEKCKELLENCGDRPRVYRNTLIFLCPSLEEKISFNKFIKDKLAWQLIEKDKNLNLTDEQKREVKNRIKKFEDDLKLRIRVLYRHILLPSKEGLKEIDLGMPTYGKEYLLDEEVYNRLKGEEILEKLSPLTIKDKYLKNDYASTKSILESFYTTPGEIRTVNEEVFKNAIKEGVKQGLFGLGRLEKDKPFCNYFKEECSPEIVEGEVVIKAELCKKEVSAKTGIVEEPTPAPSVVGEKVVAEKGEVSQLKKGYSRIYLKFPVPFGKLSDVAGIIRYINSKFSKVEIVIEILAKEGKIKNEEYEDKIKEALKQIGIDEENIEVKFKEEK